MQPRRKSDEAAPRGQQCLIRADIVERVRRAANFQKKQPGECVDEALREWLPSVEFDMRIAEEAKRRDGDCKLAEEIREIEETETVSPTLTDDWMVEP